MQNPLYFNNVITAIDKNTNEEINVEFINIGKYYKYIYCLCPFNVIDTNIILKDIIEPDEYNMILKQMILYQVKTSILKNLIHYGNIIFCKKEDINVSNHFNYILDDMVLILPFYNISFLNLQKYMDTINGSNNLDVLYNLLVIYNYFGDKIYSQSNNIQINNTIKNLSEADYWKFEYNCNCNLTQLFNKRKFNFNSIKVSKDEIITLAIKKLDTTVIKEHYLEQIFKSNKYTDPSSIISKKGYKLYNVVKNCKYTPDHILKLFSEFKDMNYTKYLLFSQLGLSREYSHLVINNKTLLIDMKNTINTNIEVFKIVFGYAWIRFYFEESICKFYMKTTDYYIFDLDTASHLPVFHFDHNLPTSNPYMPLLVANYNLNPTCNVSSVTINDMNVTSKRICNMSEFIGRFNIFLSNDKDKNILQNIDFKKYKMAITGSIMTACVQYHNPLLELFNVPNIDMNTLYNRFFNEYYCNADVDTMILTNNMIEFLDLGKSFHKELTTNILKLYEDSEPHHVNLTVIKQVYLFVTEDFIRTNITKIDYNIIISNLSQKTIINLFLPYAEKLHDLEIEKLYKNGMTEEEINMLKINHPEYFSFNLDDLVVKLYNNTKGTQVKVNTNIDIDITDDTLEKLLETEEEELFETKNIDSISMSISYKMKISTPHLDHDFEIFPIKKDDFMNTVGQFHMPCVRAYYDGSNVYLTPSCISSHMTFMNIDYKYFSGTKDPIEIINKYRMRGFGTFLNKTEIINYVKYNSLVPFWNNLYNIDLNSKNIGNCVGPLSIRHKLFFPRKFNMDYYLNTKIRPIPFDEPYENLKYLINNSLITLDNIAFYAKRYNYTFLNLEKQAHILHTGYITPLSPNIIDMISSEYTGPK